MTHPDMVRYLMTPQEAAQLTLSAMAIMEGGERFMLEMGEPVKIVDLARLMIRLHGLRPKTDIEIVFTGIRPGEKLSEELSASKRPYKKTQAPGVWEMEEKTIPSRSLALLLGALGKAVTHDRSNIKKLLFEGVSAS